MLGFLDGRDLHSVIFTSKALHNVVLHQTFATSLQTVVLNNALPKKLAITIKVFARTVTTLEIDLTNSYRRTALRDLIINNGRTLRVVTLLACTTTDSVTDQLARCPQLHTLCFVDCSLPDSARAGFGSKAFPTVRSLAIHTTPRGRILHKQFVDSWDIASHFSNLLTCYLPEESQLRCVTQCYQSPS